MDDIDSGPDVDAEPDVDAGDPSCDYNESDDATNDVLSGGTSEATGITFTPGGAENVVCGRIDPANMVAGQLADADFFDLDLGLTAGAEMPIRIVLTSPSGASLEFLSVLLVFFPDPAEPEFEVVDGADLVNGYGLVTLTFPKPPSGALRLLVVAGVDPLPPGPVGYQIRIGDRPACGNDAGAPTFSEAGDGGNNRSNDMLTGTLDQDGNVVFGLTVPAGDVPEPTNLTLAPATNVHLRGTTADVNSPGDDYLDRDTFAIATDTQINEVDVRLNWADGDVDMDLAAFLQNMADPVGQSLIVDTNEDELMTFRVTPGSTLWLWAGTFDDTGVGGDLDLPVTYDLTVCPRSVTP